MKGITNMILILVLTAISISAQRDGKAVDRARDEAAIRANVEQIVKGWNMKSGVEFAKPFAENSDYVVINGSQIKGRAANAQAHQHIFENFYKTTTLACSVEQIRFLRPDVAVVHVFATMKIPQVDTTRMDDARITMVMTKNNGKWEIAAFQNTAIVRTEAKRGN